MNRVTLKQNIENIESRLALIESKLNIYTPPSKEILEPATKPQSQPKPMSGNLLGVVASICFILAAGFIMKLSIETGWLTHEKQLGIATLFGMALFAAGIVISSSDRTYASFLPAAGATILYLTCFAAYQFYHLISFQTVIAVTSLVSGISIWFYVRFKHDIYAIIAAIGAYTAPIISNIDANAIFSLYYFIICSLTFATLSIWVESRLLTVISSYLAISITALIGLNLHMDGLIAIILAIHFLAFSIGTYFYTHLLHQELTELESWSLFPVLLISYAVEYYFISLIEPTWAPLVSIALAAVVVILYKLARQWLPERNFNSSTMILAFVTLVFFHSIYLELLPLAFRPWLFVIIVLCYGWFGIQNSQTGIKASFFSPLIALSAILGIEYLSLLNHLMTGFNWPWAVVSWAAFFSIWFAFIWRRCDLAKKDEYCYAFMAAAHLLCIMSLYQETFLYGSLAVSASWLLYALIVLGISFIRNDVIIAKSVLIILGFAAVKALLYDASSTPTIIRTLCLILTGIVLYASGYAIRKITQWNGNKDRH